MRLARHEDIIFYVIVAAKHDFAKQLIDISLVCSFWFSLCKVTNSELDLSEWHSLLYEIRINSPEVYKHGIFHIAALGKLYD